jgi:multicomponent Na+:H+ antiporter subunit D
MSNLAPLTVAVPLAGAAMMLFLNTVLPRCWVQALALAVVVAEVGLAVALLQQARSGTIVYWFGGWTPRQGVALGISFTVDQFGAGGAVLAGVVVAGAVATTRWTIESADGIVHALLLTLLAAMAGFCLTGDLFNLFVFFELMAVSAFGLAAYHTKSRGALRSTLNFAITNSLGASSFSSASLCSTAAPARSTWPRSAVSSPRWAMSTDSPSPPCRS